MRLGIGIGLGFLHHNPPAQPANSLCDAIARKVCVNVTHNGKSLKLAPHIVYERRSKRRLDAVLLARDGKAVRNPKLASYLIASLTDIALTSEPFTMLSGFNPNDPEYGTQPECFIKAI